MKLPIKKLFIILLALFAVLLLLFVYVSSNTRNNNVILKTENYLKDLPYTSDVSTGIMDNKEIFNNRECFNVTYTIISKTKEKDVNNLFTTNKEILSLIQNSKPKFDHVFIQAETDKGQAFILAIPNCQLINLSKIRNINDLINLSIKKYTKIDFKIH